ncbi:MAG: SUMF1/EgtB/PvdO family nonheme iron enzyme [Chitinispirillaceae bacterium]|nr:SUMF1/EgtB/PvdO family nonheme iron enzyme [Chitinispirillaceae bacterium]
MRNNRQRRSEGPDKSKRRPAAVAGLLAIVLLLMLLLLIIRRCSPVEMPTGVPLTIPASDTSTAVDTVETDTVSDTTVSPEVEPEIREEATIPLPGKETETTEVAAVPDTIPVADTAVPPVVDTVTDSLSTSVSPETAGCGGDTTELWVYPDPSGGLHYRGVDVAFRANRPAVIHYRFQGDTGWMKYDGTPVAVSRTTTLYFDAIDSCGKVMERRSEYYEIETARPSSECPNDMEPVRVGTMNFCIDRYEWPNRRGAVPRAYVSLYQAMDSCFAAGKRLCTVEEWSVACAGPYSWKYPYGQKYEPYACITHDTLVEPSGSKPECRGFFGIFDMAGNLLEWTSTRAVENSSFYYVTGGFWESGPKSACHDKRYSYYPQNRHNPVGFRCCKDMAGGEAPEKGGKR